MSDPLGWTAQAQEVIIGGAGKVIARIAELVTEYLVDKIVVGYPLNMDGSAGKRAEITDNFIINLADAVDCPIVRWDERLTSVSAGRAMRETGLSASKNKDKVNILAAMIMLQSYLDKEKK
jgi:putative Holliday junction resolvase